MNAGYFLIIFFLLCGLGVVSSALARTKNTPWVICVVGSAASIVLLYMSARGLVIGGTENLTLWGLPPLGNLVIEINRLSSLFLFVTGLVFFPVSLFSARYLERYSGRYNLKTFSIFYHLLFASIVLTLVAGDIVSFFIGWETMSALSYLLVNFEHENDKNTSAGLLMLLMSEAGTLAAMVGFLILAARAGSISFSSLRAVHMNLTAGACWLVFLVSFFGFGVKAGLVPLSTWLHRAHPAAPGNMSAILSGVILNLGIYGILKINLDILPASGVEKGLIVMIVGAISALVGILYATPENDMKKMLAHSSVENMGIATAGLGAGLVFLGSGHTVLAGLAIIASLYHMVNHSVYKSLLFLGASTADYRLGHRDMDRMGGLMKVMPFTALFFLIGALSIAALPPFNGFVSEWLTLQSLLQCSVLSSRGVKIIFALCGAGLALTAALAVTCFVKAFGMNFLGKARAPEVTKASEAPRSMTIAMGILAVACLLFGILPTYILPVMDHVVQPYVHESTIDQLVPPFFTVSKGNPQFPEAFVSDFHKLGAQVGRNVLPGRGLVIMHRGEKRNPVIFAMSPSYTIIVLILILGGSFVFVRFITRKKPVRSGPAWAAGIRELSPNMVYTATGFSNPVRVIFRGIFRPVPVSDTTETIHHHFLEAIKKEVKQPHLIDRVLGRPIILAGQFLAKSMGKMHSGHVNAYAAYVLLALLFVLAIGLV